MDIFKIVSICLSSVIIILLLNKLNNEYAIYISIFINIAVTVFSLGILLPVFGYIKEISSSSDFSSLINILFKSTGICILCSFGAEICRDAGANSLAGRIELSGKCTLLAYSLPLIREVFVFASAFID